MMYTQLRAFDAVAREGSFSRAAELLSLTQPAITIQVKALEAAYGVQLLNREGRRIVLTEVGEKLFRITRQFTTLEETIDETLGQSQKKPETRLRLVVDGPHVVMRLLSQLRLQHPHIKLAVGTGNSAFVRQELLDRRADIAILPGIKGHLKVHAIPFWHHKAVLIASRGSPLSERASVEFTDLNDLPMLRREHGSMTQTRIDAAFKQAGISANSLVELGSREALIEAVSQGLGYGIVWDGEAQDTERLRAIPITGSNLQSTDFIACLKSERERTAIRSLFAIAAKLSNGASG
ncbi:LysR family transcriptional regulator (plasmid) [Phyllobacterium sp. 628]|uniref:LysR substrate-binding domain-containing protein n=1 Tax=Phyllobacterium sp. 628 TaxID=2718938 RepID=UPI0016623CE8|nr:LysR substrate-binding domain-containing protein [Phyllobacterium sp. 628]QND54508.1 LysR family transcriptional regulator [Phyllobacterium sp. 628]